MDVKLILFKKKIAQNETIISPSDFGFHNMLIGKKCSFLDFEYAGIDDAAKLICDFICQPDLQLNKKQINFFIKVFTTRIFMKIRTVSFFLKVCTKRIFTKVISLLKCVQRKSFYNKVIIKEFLY